MNFWTMNAFIVRKFLNFDNRFPDVQPPLANNSLVSLTEISPWPNRVPGHEPWARVMKQDKGDGGDDGTTENEENEGYKNNVDWIDQYDNETDPEGLEPIGKVEGDETIERGPLWRR